MRWTSVKSSAISELAYDRKTKTLHVRFISGKYYSYEQIGYHRFNKLRTAESIGKYFNLAIKPKKDKPNVKQETL